MKIYAKQIGQDEFILVNEYGEQVSEENEPIYHPVGASFRCKLSDVKYPLYGYTLETMEKEEILTQYENLNNDDIFTENSSSKMYRAFRIKNMDRRRGEPVVDVNGVFLVSFDDGDRGDPADWFEWGIKNENSIQYRKQYNLAKSILVDYLNDEFPDELAEIFMEDFLKNANSKEWIISEKQLVMWMEKLMHEYSDDGSKYEV